MEDKKIPFNLEAERALLNSILTDADASIDILESFNENDFYLEAHKVIYRVIKDMDNNDISIDLVTLTDMLEKKDLLKKVGGLSYIDSLTIALPSTANYKNYMAIVERDSIARKLLKAANSIAEEAVKCEDYKDALANAESLIYNIAENKDKSQLQQAADASSEVLKKINMAISDKDAFRGIPSHFENLDRLLNGLHRSDLMLIAARPALGKTSFSMNIVANIIAKDPEKVVAVFSLEMSAEQLVQRLLSNISETSMKDAQRGSLSIDGLKRIYQANKVVTNSKLFIDDSSMTNPGQILSKCRRLVKREGRIDLLVVDYLQLMVSNDGKESRQEAVSDFSRRMKIIAKELDVPVILISQLSRAVEKREEKIPMLSDLRESGSIEQDADIVMLLHKPDEKNTDDENLRQLIIAKHRNGEVGSIYFRWKGDSLKFFSIEDPHLNISKSPKYIPPKEDNDRLESADTVRLEPASSENYEPVEYTYQPTPEDVYEQYDNEPVPPLKLDEDVPKAESIKSDELKITDDGKLDF